MEKVDFSIQVCYNKGNEFGTLVAAHNGRISGKFFVSIELQRIIDFAVVYHKDCMNACHGAVFKVYQSFQFAR